jgi:hypothetical protein
VGNRKRALGAEAAKETVIVRSEIMRPVCQTKMKKALWALFLSLVSSPMAGHSQSESLTLEIKKQTIENLSALLPDRYAYKELGPKLQLLLQQNLKSGKYDSIASAADFAEAVTKDLRSLNFDRHLALNYNPQPQATNTSSSAPQLTPEERAKRASDFNRQMNFGFKSVQFLNGNIGYLKFDYFDAYLDYSRPVVDAAMSFLRNSDAIIVDLRENGGGGSQMVGYIAGFFFKERTLSGTSYERLSDTTTQGFIEPQPKEKQLADVALYILTSRRTVSAAEGLAYDLKYLKGAKVIGETSAGAANPGRVTRLNHLFTAFIPNRHGASVVTGTNWEGTGVPVDISSAADDALRIAKLVALKHLQQKASEGLQKKRFDAYITYLEKTNPEKELPLKALREYVGEYQGGRTVVLKNGKLHYSRVAETSGRLHFISSDLFMLAEGDVTVVFKRDKQNRVIALETRWSLSESASMATKIK